MFMKERKIFVLTISIFILGMVVFPLILHIPIIKYMVDVLLSFTENEEYKVAYVEFFGAIIGSFIAICGSVWIQGRVDEKEEIERQKKYACIVYNDLDLAFDELIKIFRDTELIHGL